MESYSLIDDVYRIPGGYGSSGEIYGGILLRGNPPVLIGASGGDTFVNNLIEILDTLEITTTLNIFLPNFLWQEIITCIKIQEKYPDAIFHIHEDIVERLESPRDNFFKDRFDPSTKNAINKYSKKLIKSFENVRKVNKLTNFETDKTKILIVPFDGPHDGHIFIYSRDHRLLCCGVILGLTPTDSRLYYLDFTGTIKHYLAAISFLDQAKAEIIAPAYDEPRFTNTSPLSTFEIRNAIESDIEAIFEILTLNFQSFDNIVSKYRNLHGRSLQTSPYDEISFESTLIRHHLSDLIKDGKVLEENNQYRKS